MKVNFSKIEVKTIDGNKEAVDLRLAVGNTRNMQGRNPEGCELGGAIYHSDGDMELTDEQVATVTRYAAQLPYVFRMGLQSALTHQK